jgi:GT2 family glycosyltransferase/glycosyltransferase involved in cell wall biosynthesis
MNARPLVSVVLVNFRGAADTLEAIRHLGELDYPKDRLEIVVVENGSGDDSAAVLAAGAPHVKLVVSKVNHGFAGGCNLGVRSSSGDVVAFLNNDARPDPGWVSAAVDVLERDPAVGAVASRVLDWEGQRVDYIDAGLAWYGMGYKPFTSELASRLRDEPHDVLFGTGSAMFVRRSVYDQLRGFDERYFMFFEDVDLGWRLNLLGYRYRYQPASLAFHKHHASMSSFGSHKEQYLLERNALFTLYKNLGDEGLAEALPAALLLAARRGVTLGEIDSNSFDLRAGGSNDPEQEFPAVTLAPVFAMDRFVEELDALKADRARIQSTRVVSDARLWPLFGDADAPVIQIPRFLDGYEKVVSAFDVASAPTGSRVLVITGDPIGVRLAGPAIRAWNMAAALARENEVVLLTLSGAEAVDAPFRIEHVAPGDDRGFAPLEAWADVIVFQGHAMSVFEGLRTSQKILVADIYDPMHLEQLEQSRELGEATWTMQVSDATDVLNEQLERADFLLCASDRQRHFYLGQLAALGRLNPQTYRDDPDLTGLLAVVPFGLPSDPVEHVRPVLKGVHPGIGRDDKLVLWGGGLYNWFDPLTLIRAMGKLAAKHPEVRLFFQGTKHPHPGVPEMEIVAKSRALADGLGLLDKIVFFNESWVEYSDRQNYLAEADAGVSTHHAHVETTFSFRTRILDYLWGGLPMVVTEGDHFADLVDRAGLGIAVPADDEAALAAALEAMLFDADAAQAARANIAVVREEYRWDVVLRPLVEFVRHARPAADRAGGTTAGLRRRAPRRRRSGLRHDISRVVHYLGNGGPVVVWRKVRRRLTVR